MLKLLPSNFFIHLLVVPLAALFTRPSAAELKNEDGHKMDKEELLSRVIDLDEVAIDAAPFQLVLGSSLYKVTACTLPP